MRLKTAVLCLLCCVGTLSAQEFTYVDWDVLKADSLPVQYTEVIPLEDDYASYNYDVRLEYPEYVRLTADETALVSVWGDSLPESPEVEVSVGVSRKKGVLDVSFVPFVLRDGKYYKITSFKMTISRTGKPVALSLATRSTTTTTSRYASSSVLASGTWVKIGITEDGVYRLTTSALRSMGFSDPSRVKLYGYGGHVQDEEIDADNDYDDLEEVPLYRDDNGLLFFGKGLVSWTATNSRGRATHSINTYATQACYFLTEGDSVLSIATETASSTPQSTLTYTPANTLYHKEEYSWYESGRTFYESTNYASSNSHTYQLATVDPVSSSTASLRVNFTAHSTSSTTYLTTSVDGVQLGNSSIGVSGEYNAARETTQTYTVSSLQSGTTGTSVTLTSTSGIDARLGFLELCYSRQLTMTEDYLYIRHTVTNPASFAIDTNGRTGVKLWRLGQRGTPMVEMSGTLSDNTYTVPVDDPTLEYVAVDVNADYPSPTYIGKVDNQDLHALSALDMVIIIPASGTLNTQAERLAEAHRTIDGLRVQVVRADQIYNEFSSGTPDATAYRRFMKMLYDRADSDSDMPRYLLLFGDGFWDNRMLTSSLSGYDPDDYLLCYESENSLSHTSTYVMEEYYGLLDDGEGSSLLRDKPDLGVGRFPVVTAAQAAIMVDKTIDYMENTYADSWRNVVCVMGDDGDSNDHIEKAELISAIVEDEHPEMVVNRIYWDAYKRTSTSSGNTYPGVEADIQTQMDEGCLMMNYTGHGNPRELSHEFSIQISDFASFTSPNLPLWVTAACDVSPFDMAEDNIGETAVLIEDGAAVAFYGTARTVYSSQNSLMNRYFTRYVLGYDDDGTRNTIGDAVRLAKVNLISGSSGTDTSTNKFHFVLLGDPALKLGVPQYELVVDSINGIAVGDSVTANFMAGSVASVAGHVEDGSGNRVTDYSGVLSATVYDSETEVSCLNNDGASSPVVTYITRDKKLYTGKDSVSNGTFSFTFSVPLDIKYSGESGKIVLYAIDNDKRNEANGYSEDVTVGGTSDELSSDTEGPAITAYLNREDFTWGGTVYSTPYFVALLEDESGINVTNSAEGHDLELIIDNDPSTTYVLNDEYESEFGDYTKGHVAYVIPELEDGTHSLTFRAWDVMNNSSTVNLEFNVSHKASPDLITLTCSENPASTQTTFIIYYDRPGTECTFSLEVFDYAGRKLWTHSESGTSSDGIYNVTWNLTTSSGMPLSTGVYLYRAHVATTGSKASSEANKIVIMKQ